MNKRHVIALIVGIVLLAVPILSGVPKQTAAPVATDSLAKLSDLTTLETALSKEIDKKADKDDIPEGAGLSESDVKKVVDDSLGGYMKESEIEQWLTDNGYKKSSTSTTPAGTTAGEYGQLVDSRDDLELWLEKVSYDADDEFFSTSAGDNKARFDFVVVNKDESNSHDYRVTVSFLPDEDDLDASPNPNKVIIASATSSAEFTFTRSPEPLPGFFDKDTELSYRGTDKVLKGDAEDFKLTVYVTQTEAKNIDWEIEYDIRDLD